MSARLNPRRRAERRAQLEAQAKAELRLKMMDVAWRRAQQAERRKAQLKAMRG